MQASKPERLRHLADLLERNGVTLGTTDKQIQALNDWFRQEVEADPANPRAIDERFRDPDWFLRVVNVAERHSRSPRHTGA